LSWLKYYRYSWLLLGLLLVAVAAIFGVERNGARLWLNLGAFQFQPVELLKILLVVYLATYLDERRHLIGASYYLKGVRLPPLPYLIPIGLMWGLTISLIIIQKDLGAALLFFTIFLAMLYVATNSGWYVIAGLSAFVALQFGPPLDIPLQSQVSLHVSAADLDRFGHRFEYAAPFGPHVRRINSAVTRRHLAHGDERVGVDPRSGRTAQ
jgi:cell division protein FtsW (lipid II flippase)